MHMTRGSTNRVAVGRQVGSGGRVEAPSKPVINVELFQRRVTVAPTEAGGPRFRFVCCWRERGKSMRVRPVL